MSGTLEKVAREREFHNEWAKSIDLNGPPVDSDAETAADDEPRSRMSRARL